MTTVALKDGILASDSRSTVGGVIFDDNIRKLYRVKDGWVGCSGANADIEKLVDHLITPKDESMLGELIAYGILMQDDGKSYLLGTNDGCYYRTLIPSNCWAIGSGADFAIASMRGGSSATDAVKMAIQCDIHSGGIVQSVKRGQKK